MAEVNVKKSIVGTLADASRTFLNTEVDYLAIETLVLSGKQPDRNQGAT